MVYFSSFISKQKIYWGILAILIFCAFKQIITVEASTAIIVFILTWWMVFLMALPFGSNPPQTIEKGHANSAPANPMLKKKLAWTTVISLILGLIIIYFIQHSGYSFYDNAY